MVTRSPSSRDVPRLLAALGRQSGVERDAAVAHLRILGEKAYGRVAELLASDAPADARVAAVRVLEDVGDPRARRALLVASRDRDPQVAAAALAALPEGATPDASPDPLDDPQAARAWLAAHQSAPLSELHEFIGRVREREAAERGTAQREDWRVTRGAAHAALARRASSVALYDLRETFETAERALPLDFLAAVSVIGDAACLEPMARAWSAASGDTWWREHLAAAAAVIMRRGRLTGRSGLIKRIRLKYPGFV